MNQEFPHRLGSESLSAIQSGDLTFEASLVLKNGELCLVVHDDLGLDREVQKELQSQKVRLLIEKSEDVEPEAKNDLARPSKLANRGLFSSRGGRSSSL